MSFMDQVKQALKLRENMNDARQYRDTIGNMFGVCSDKYRNADAVWFATIVPCMDAECSIVDRISAQYYN